MQICVCSLFASQLTIQWKCTSNVHCSSLAMWFTGGVWLSQLLMTQDLYIEIRTPSGLSTCCSLSRKSAKMLTTALQLEVESLECLYLRASCHHALGEFTDAVSLIITCRIQSVLE